ncbi:SusD/RagB family nutrient-binding outer membrane lipoprotein [Dyadobacter luteus]|uniref:SusD/RagB family nutrient-binding outer membrane lipoprotein n=1 Tax=Dyadobacter luteus TaxID=2259619 RepID=A0A3D8Y7P7_9BACT|nr:SusD/RagB family nutrient-binding outer membrane lipoprotein [Dyadobacter luteus]REA59051.1 SusD/RagB family nutrient-binding outer membrane lipoprotein [Dyadobacter luteus]
MNILKLIPKYTLVIGLAMMSSCNDRLDEVNINPNGLDLSKANPNLLMPTVMTSAAMEYLKLGYGDVGGVAQHIQHDGWHEGVNSYGWGPQDWTAWYNMLRNNQLMLERATTIDSKFHMGVALTMKAFVFGTITDLWGDAPYTAAITGAKVDGTVTPVYDSQEVIYRGIIEDLKQASAHFATKDNSAYLTNYDVYYAGDASKWQKFANSLLLRYYMRISAKLPDVAKAGIESIYSSGIYIKLPSEDAVMNYLGTTADLSWPGAIQWDAQQTNFRRIKPAQTLVSKLLSNNDPRLTVWIAPVHCQWVADESLTVPLDEFIRKDGVIQTGIVSLTDIQYQTQIKAGAKFTRHYNPKLYTGTGTDAINTGLYVGIPAGMRQPDFYNRNPTTGQVVQNQHVSQLADVYRGSTGGILKARLMSASETSFILAEAAQKGWTAGTAKEHYENGIKNSLTTWGIESKYAAYIAEKNVAFNNSLAQIIDQKWIASWTVGTEAWFDFRRTGLPALVAGNASTENVLPVRFNYGDNELNFNGSNADAAINKLEVTSHSGLRGKNSQWSKPWLVQGTGKPW